MVCAYAHGAPQFFAAADERGELFARSLQVGGVFGFGIPAGFAGPLPIGEVARVYADFLDVLDGLHRGCRQKVYVGDEGR